MKQGKVAIGYLDGGRWSATFGMCLRDLYLYDAGHSNRVAFEGAMELRCLAGVGGIPDGRNEIVARFLGLAEAEWLWFVDTDMGFSKDTVDRLVESADPVERPIMGGLCFRLARQAAPSAFYGNRYGIVPTLFDWVDEHKGFLPKIRYERDTVQEVGGTGAACLLIHRSVFGKLGANCFNLLRFSDDVALSEDLSFCRRAIDSGFPVHVNTAVKTSHDKAPLFLDEEMYLSTRPWIDT